MNTLTVDNLTPGDSYKVQMRSRYYNADRSVHESSGPWTATTTQRVKDHPPAAPTGLAASQVAHDSLTLSWNDPQDANITGYRIQRGTEANSLSTIEDNTESANTSFTDSTVEPETTYHYAVIALSQDGDGAQSTTSVTTLAEPEETVQNDPPAAPTGLVASQVGHSVLTLTWNGPQDDNITGYRILRGPSADSLAAIQADTRNNRTEYEDDTVAADTTYHYAVIAMSQDGDGAQSTTISATTTAAPAPKETPTPRGPRATDTTAPTVRSITRQDPTSSPTNSDTLTWRVTFSEAVESVDAADFMVTGTTATLTVTTVTNLTGVYDVTASGGDLASVDGTVTLAFAGNQNIADPENNTLTATTPTGANDPTFELDNTVPTFVSGTANGTLIVMTFSEELDPNSLPQASAFTITALSSLPVPEPFANSVSIEGAMVTLTVAPAFITDHAVQVYNNAHQGAGGVPLQDAAGNAVQPAATVGSYSVTNETPIGPPASLTAEAGDGRVRLVWTGPAGTSQLVRYQYRYAAGASVPVETDWSGPTVDIFQTTVLLFGLTNGTPHAFEVRAVHDSEVGAAATVSATPLADACSTPDLGDRREVWSATLTVGRDIDPQSGATNAGYVRGSYGSLPQDGDSFIIGGASYTIEYIYTLVRSDGDRRRLFLELVDDRRFTPAVKEALRFHWCSDSSGFDDPSSIDYRVSNDNQADWSLYDTRELALSLPANTDTTAPTVTSITPQDPTSSPTSSDTLTWRVTFSEAVESVDPADFVITGTTATLTVTAVTSMTGVYDVTASGGDLASVDATVTLAFAADQNIVDPSDNTLTATTPTGANDPTFELDNTVPTFVSGTANGTLIVLTFSEDLDPNSLPPGEAFDVSTLGDFSTPQPVVNSVAIEGTMVTLTVTPALFTDHTVTVSNNAYDDGMGRVPLKDFAGNAVQPAATVGSYSVTNETPIGPPASLRAEAGDGRVRLVWTGPAGVDFQTANHQYRYAAGASVPVDTVWSETTNLGNLNTLVQGLANGTAYAFEVRAIRGSDVGAAATVSATPMADTCTPDLGDRREVWSATLTVGRSIDSHTGQTSAGYRSGSYGSLPQDGDRIIIGGASYTIKYILTIVRGDGIRRQLFLELVDDRRFTPAVKGALRFHWCSDSSGLANPTPAGYQASNNHEADWSLYNTRELALSLPANNDATGTPDITGRALPGQTLTAGMGNVADADGLPQNASDFAWQWIRVADETDTPIQDATSSTYTLTDDDVGKQVKVAMSFTDSLSGVESLTSDAYPSSSTVQRVLVSNIGQTVITQNDNAGELTILDAAQEFTTGSNETGYTLSSIDLELTVASTSNLPVVKLFSGSANGTEVATLTAPTNASTGKTTYTFTVPTAITLEGDTSYWVMAETGGGTWHTVGFAEDATPAPDWSIADRDEFRVFSSTGPFSTDALVALMIRVNGTVNNPFLENFRADAGNAQVTLRWDNPGDSSITKYQYRQRFTSESAWDPDWTDIPGSGASTTSYTVRNLANRTPYTFQIRAVRGNEPTATSTASATPEGPPTAPLAPLNLAARAQDEGITASWQIPPAGDERAPVTSYKVRYRQVGMGTSPWQNLTRANDDRSTTQEINNLTNRQHYQVQVAAVNRVGTGQWASVKATPQAPDSPPPAPTGDAALTLGILGLFWDNSTTGNTLWADTCTGLRSFHIIWDGPKGHDRAADEWAAHINTSGGAGAVTYSFRETPIPIQEGDEDSEPQHSGYYELNGTVNFEGNGSLSVNVRGRFGQTWGTWSPTGSLYCYTTEKPSRN